MTGINNNIEYQIKIYNESTYTVGSIDNVNSYDKIYFGDNAREYPTSKHGVSIIQNGEIVNKCLIVGSGGSTTIHENSSVRYKNQLLICCCNSVFCISLPNLELEWVKVFDSATCFQIFELNDSFIIHGETQVSKIDSNGNLKWKFGGEDIFVSIDNEVEFKILEDGIILCDFANTFYKIDFDGKLIWSKNEKRKS